ncbi:MAG: hypothetical protein ACKVE4_00730 [Dissulfuribacterales bacterium]
MIVKFPILPDRVRKVPKSFRWIDHRLVRNRYIEKCCHTSAALYLFLVCVGDDKGLSYYGDESLMKKLSMNPHTLQNARSELIQNNLIAWQKPIYQVLSLNPASVKKRRPPGSAVPIGTILKNAMEGNND